MTIAASAVLVGLFASFGMMEAVVRLFFSEPVLPRFVVDSGVGIRFNQSNVTTEHYYPNQYRVTITTNQAGLRGTKDYTVPKPPNTYRIAMLGDSMLFGFGVADNEVVSYQLEHLLNRTAKNRKFEVLNFGVSGFGTAEQLVAYEKLVRPYKPDAVVVFYFSNDVGNTIVSGLFKVGADGKLERTDKSYLPGVRLREILYAIPPVRWLFEHSQAWNFIRNRLSGIVLRGFLAEHDMRSSTQQNPAAMELTRRVFIELLRKIRSDGARSLIFIIPDRKMKTNFPVSFQTIDSLQAIAIDGRKFLSRTDYYDIDGHWRSRGHRNAAEVLRERVLGLLD
ncbi:MAG: SGNH/GDSL hydrolase family protein [Proteobacteria bacterium]|nr:SGNH/GDSL hydrolase family protein [Pseudomonadota bacterium]